MAQILDPTQPVGSRSAGLGDDEIRALKQYLIYVFGLPVSPQQLLTPAMSIDVNGVVTLTSPVKGARGLPGVYGFTAVNNAATPTGKLDLSANIITAKQASDHAVITAPPGSLTVDINLAGPIALGLDQAAAFANNTWVHFYYIVNSSTGAISAIASLNISTPVLPTGFTHFVYATSVYKDGTGSLRLVYCRGSTVAYKVAQTIVSAQANANFTLPVSLATFVPPNALMLGMSTVLSGGSVTVAGSDFLDVGVAPSTQTVPATVIFSGLTSAGISRSSFVIPNVNQTFYYAITRNSSGGISVVTTMWITSYTVPNGDS